MKRDLKATAQAFQTEGKVSSDPVGVYIESYSMPNLASSMLFRISNYIFMRASAIDAPGGFLFEWWSVFWDIFIARTNEKHSEVAASYIEVSYKCPLCFSFKCPILILFFLFPNECPISKFASKIMTVFPFCPSLIFFVIW